MLRLVVIAIVFAPLAAHAQPASDAGVPDAAPPDAAPPDAPPPDAAPQPAAPAAAVTCTGTLDGHAVDVASHAPVVAATVTVGDQLLATTDDNGRFTLTGLCAGPMTIVVEREDYQRAETKVVIGPHASVEVTMKFGGEVIEVHDRAPDPPEMRATATLSGAALERTRGQGLAAAVADVPGVAELRSASGMGKTIIRGQFGRRLLLLVDGVRHRAQEWGLEHAPEIDPFIADKIRIVRGAGGVRYGSDAIGGVVLVDPPDLRRVPGYNGELHLIGTSNGLGGTVAGRLQNVFEGLPALSMQLEGSAKRLQAARTPRYALANTGLFEWNAGTTVGYRATTSEYKVSLRHYQAKLGVCRCLRIESREDFLASIEREEPIGADQYTAEFAIGRPYQTVSHDTAVARARWEREQVGTFTATYSFQHDRRLEYDVVRQSITDAQYRFRLMTHDVEGVFEHNPVHLSEHWHLRGAAGLVGMAQFNIYGGLQLIPDHQSLGGGAYVSERLVGHDTDVEVGARYDFLARTASLARIDFLRLVRSRQLPMTACGGGTGDPVDCDSRFHLLTASAGVLHRWSDAWSTKLDISTASRAPNTDEQYLNGSAPTFPVLGLGKPDLKRETTYSTSLTLGHESKYVTGEASAYVNRINDYIFFAPALDEMGQPIFDVLVRGTFPRFTTQAVDALFYGADGGIEVKPHESLELGVQASLVRAKDIDHDKYLVYIPSDRVRGSITYRAPETRSLRKSFATLTGTYVAQQRRYDINADFAAPPPAYFLLDAELGTETCIGHHDLRLALQGQNLTNARYRDYTSLLRYFADEPGWSVLLRASVFFDSKKKGN
jgi:iron complex outermembrane recepter protein